MEAAGLVLGVLPVAVGVLGVCLDATGEYKHTKKRVRELQVQVIVFNNTCRGLLGRLVLPEHMARLLNGIGWDDPKLRDLLRGHIGADAAAAFIELAKSFKSSLDYLRKILGLDENMKVRRLYASGLWHLGCRGLKSRP